ncbi:MAG: cytochrome P450 [Acidimicrobiales bacterium]
MTGTRAEADFDHQSLAWLAERHSHNAELRQQCPVVWNQHYGGFWFVTGYDEVSAVARDSETFTPRFEESASDGLRYIGIMGIPRGEGMPPIGIAEAEGDRHAALRRTINPFMLPPAVAEDRPFLERTASWFLDLKIADGQMDMVHDFTNPVPALWTMRMLDLPLQGWERFADYFHASAAYGQETDEYKRAVSHTPEMVAEVTEIIEERRARPGDDLLSRLAAMEVRGDTLGNDDLIAVIWNLIGGGLDTTTSLTSLALIHLAEHPDLRKRLVADPNLLLPACEEFLRWTSINETLTRTCTKDTELGGQEVKRGDFVMMSWLGANFDPSVFDRPDDVDIDRSPNPHLAFGVGAHRCIGLHVARTLFDVMLREILTRIPEYRVDLEATQYYQGNPELTGAVRMPVTFAPGLPVGAERPY